MPAPSTYPVWMQKTGVPDAMVLDLNGYNYAISQGYTLPSITPETTVAPGEIIDDTSLSVARPDPNAPTQVP